MSSSETSSVSSMISSRTFVERTSSLTRKSRSSSVWPEVFRNCWYCLSFGNDCFFWSSNCFWTSSSLTSMSRASASCWIHSAEIRNCMTCCLSESNSCSHWFLRSSSVGFGAPGGTGCCFFASTHSVKSGGSGTTISPPAPGGCWPCAAAWSQWSNSSCLMTVSSTLATAPEGTSFPQPATTTATMAPVRARK